MNPRQCLSEVNHFIHSATYGTCIFGKSFLEIYKSVIQHTRSLALIKIQKKKCDV